MSNRASVGAPVEDRSDFLREIRESRKESREASRVYRYYPVLAAGSRYMALWEIEQTGQFEECVRGQQKLFVAFIHRKLLWQGEKFKAHISCSTGRVFKTYSSNVVETVEEAFRRLEFHRQQHLRHIRLLDLSNLERIKVEMSALQAEIDRVEKELQDPSYMLSVARLRPDQT